MPVITCAKCEETFLKPKPVDEPEMCGGCRTDLQQEINRIDRQNDRYTKRGKIKNRLHDIPDEAIPEDLALHIEEVANPEITERQYCLGKLNELKTIGDKEIHDIENDITEKDRGKIVLKKRYR